MRRINDAEVFSSITEINGDVVNVGRTIRANEKSDRYVVNMSFDFANVSRAELIGIAIRQLTVDVQNGGLRNAVRDMVEGKSTLENVSATWEIKHSVRDMLDRDRKKAGPRDPKKAVTNMLAKMSGEERAALLAEYMAAAKAEKAGKSKG